MLARLRSGKDVEEPMAALSGFAPEEEVPFSYYELDVHFLESEQRKMSEYKESRDE